MNLTSTPASEQGAYDGKCSKVAILDQLLPQLFLFTVAIIDMIEYLPIIMKSESIHKLTLFCTFYIVVCLGGI